jgi:hypothetical protein
MNNTRYAISADMAQQTYGRSVFVFETFEEKKYAGCYRGKKK